jgi:hypothetical protein
MCNVRIVGAQALKMSTQFPERFGVLLINSYAIQIKVAQVAELRQFDP